MLKRSILLVAVFLGACTQSHELATPKGPVFGLNAGHWTPAPADLVPPPSGKP
jgi:hypothetical protein